MGEGENLIFSIQRGVPVSTFFPSRATYQIFFFFFGGGGITSSHDLAAGFKDSLSQVCPHYYMLYSIEIYLGIELAVVRVFVGSMCGIHIETMSKQC